MTNEEEINELNSRVKVTLKPSQIHGIGVFPLRKILKDEKLYLDAYPKPYKLPYGSFNKLFPWIKNEILTHWPQVTCNSAFAWPDVKFQAWMNHSNDANYDPFSDIALRDIEKDEEITEDYHLIKGAKEVFDFL